MSQGSFNFKYVGSQRETGQTSYAGLGIYFDLFWKLKFHAVVDMFFPPRRSNQGWPYWYHLMSLILLNLLGGESVDDIDVLENDEGLCRLMGRYERSLSKQARRALNRGFRKGRTRTFPSSSAVRRFLNLFSIEESCCFQPGAHVSELSESHGGLINLVAHLLSFAQKNRPCRTGTLDMDATIVKSDKSDARMSYKGYRGYQPLNLYWWEQEMVVHSEFRNGNVPANFELKRFLEDGLLNMPQGVTQVYLRSDGAGHNYDLLDYCEKGENQRFGRIEFCVSSIMNKELKESVESEPSNSWRPLYKHLDNGSKISSGREWAEVPYACRKGFCKNAPLYRYIVIREPIAQPVFEEFESEESYDFPTVKCDDNRYRVRGIVTNMDWEGETLIHWHRKRCGRSEQLHSVMKTDLSGGRLPCGEFGANACWWAVMVLSLNFHALIKELVLDGSWRHRRMKAVRFWIINIAACVVNRSRQLHIVLRRKETMMEALNKWRKKLLRLIPLPSG